MASWCPIYTFKPHTGNTSIQRPGSGPPCLPALWSCPRPISNSQSSMHCCTSTSILSTSSSSRGLTGLSPGISHLGGFTLRCLQRLSCPGLAILPCAWRRNRSTSGPVHPGPVSRTKDGLLSNILRPRRIGTELSHDVLNPGSRTALMGEQPNPLDLLQPQDAMSRHRGAKTTPSM